MTIDNDTSYRRLYRSDEDRVVAGICGGLGEYFCIDPVLIRLLWIVSIMLGGGGLIIYLLGWLLIPRRPMDLG